MHPGSMLAPKERVVLKAVYHGFLNKCEVEKLYIQMQHDSSDWMPPENIFSKCCCHRER